MKKLTINTVVFLMAIFSFTGCLKKDDMNIDASKSPSTFLQMEYVIGAGSSNTIGSGLAYFGNGALTYPGTDVADTATYTVAIRGANALSQDLTVTIGADGNALNDNFSTDSITYLAMPDTLFHLINTTATIKAGSRVATFQVVFYPSKIDITQNYMLPITVTNNHSVPLSGNFGHLYFHAIGNPLAGSYVWDFTRYNTSDGSGSPTGASFTGGTNTFIPVNPTTFQVTSGYYTRAARYVVSFKNIAGVLSNFSVILNADDVKSVFIANGITVVQNPKIITADPVNKIFTFQYVVQNSSGFRWLVDSYHP